MKKHLLILSFLFSSLSLFAQNISAYTDFSNFFYVFDDGATQPLERSPVKWYKIGGNTVAYVDNTGNLKAYYKGEIKTLNDAAPYQTFVNDEMVAYRYGNVLSIFDKGNTTLLSGWATNILVGDSMVGCVDDNVHVYKIYYKGQTQILPDNIDYNSVEGFRMGDNILAYNNRDGYFKIYYRGQVFNTEVYQPTQYKAGANTVAFVNDATQEFNVFYKGAVKVLEQQPPKSFQVADDMVAYVDYSDNFKVFYNGNTVQLLSSAPQSYTASDNLLVYADNVNFNVAFKGKNYSLGRYIPANFKQDMSTLAYLDSQGFVNVFFEGKTDCACNEKAGTYDVNGNVVKYTNSINETHFFLNGNKY